MFTPRIVKNEDIERVAETRLNRYQEKWSKIDWPPIPIEKVVAQVYGLTILWDKIEEAEDEILLGGLNPMEKLIILNEGRKELFVQKPGLERSTIGHEAGHWEFDIDKSALNYPMLFESLKERALLRRSRKHGEVLCFRDGLGD